MSLFKKMTVAGGLALVCLGAFSQAQLPPAGDAGKGGSKQIDPYAEAARQLESILACKQGTKIDARAVEARFEAFGMRKAEGGVFLPPTNTPAVSLFSDEVLAADVTDSDGEKKVSVYLKKQSGKQMAKKLGVSKINEFASTEEASYFKETSKKTTLMVGSADELHIGNTGKILRFNSAVTCQVMK